MIDIGDAAGGPLFLVVRLADSFQNQTVDLNTHLPLAPAQLDSGAMGHLLWQGVPEE